MKSVVADAHSPNVRRPFELTTFKICNEFGLTAMLKAAFVEQAGCRRIFTRINELAEKTLHISRFRRLSEERDHARLYVLADYTTAE